MSNVAKCGGCGKDEAELGQSFKQCAKCGSAKYCSRECQKDNWKEHKRTCASGAASRAADIFGVPTNTSDGASTDRSNLNATSQRQGSSTKNLDTSIEKPFTKLHEKTWLHDRSGKVVFKLLIDAYRMRMEDLYNFHQPEADSLYCGAASGEKRFRRFLRLAEAKPALLPTWWSSEKSAECVAFGKSDKDLGLQFSIEKHDTQEYYGNNDMPMQLRMFAEQVYGRGVGGQRGAVMLAMKMSMEGGRGGVQSQFDLSPTVGRFHWQREHQCDTPS